MPSTNTQVRSGNLVKVLIDGKTVGLIQSLSCNDDFGYEPVSGIGSPTPVEHVPGMTRFSLQANSVVLKKELLIDMGFIPKNSADVLKGLIFDVEIYDTRENTMVKKYVGCSYASGSVDIQAHRVISRSMQIMALDVVGAL